MQTDREVETQSIGLLILRAVGDKLNGIICHMSEDKASAIDPWATAVFNQNYGAEMMQKKITRTKYGKAA